MTDTPSSNLINDAAQNDRLRSGGVQKPRLKSTGSLDGPGKVGTSSLPYSHNVPYTNLTVAPRQSQCVKLLTDFESVLGKFESGRRRPPSAGYQTPADLRLALGRASTFRERRPLVRFTGVLRAGCWHWRVITLALTETPYFPAFRRLPERRWILARWAMSGRHKSCSRVGPSPHWTQPMFGDLLPTREIGGTGHLTYAAGADGSTGGQTAGRPTRSAISVP
jgi:hypothetical protein